MNSPRNTSDRFIDAVHRRMVIVNLFEQVGLASSAAAILAILLIAVAIWQATPTLPILLCASVIGILGGVMLAMHRWPTRRAAATEADRQLCLDDLLGTAFSLPHSEDDFAVAMRMMADAKCALHAPSEVIFRRLGVRSWSAIAVVMSIAATLSVIPFGPSPSHAIDANAFVLSASANEPVASTSPRASSGSTARSNDPASDGASNISTPLDPQRDPSATNPASPSPTRTTGNGSAGTGSGNSSAPTKLQTDSQAATPAVGHSDKNGAVSGGGGTSNNTSENNEDSIGVQRANTSSAPVPAWRGSSENRGASGQGSPARNDDVPPEHRDLVRDFFEIRSNIP